MLFIAWPFWGITSWIIAKAMKPTWLQATVFVVLMLSSGYGLWKLYVYKPIEIPNPRIVVTDLKLYLPSQRNAQQFMLRWHFKDGGEFPIVERTTLSATTAAHGKLTEYEERDAMKKIWERLDTSEDRMDKNELQPNEPPRFSDLTDSGNDFGIKDEPAFASGDRVIYLFLVFIYRDSKTPPTYRGVTEYCGYYYKTTDFFHECAGVRDRIYLQHSDLRGVFTDIP